MSSSAAEVGVGATPHARVIYRLLAALPRGGGGVGRRPEVQPSAARLVLAARRQIERARVVRRDAHSACLCPSPIQPDVAWIAHRVNVIPDSADIACAAAGVHWRARRHRAALGGSAPERESDLLGPAVGRRAVDVFRGVRAAPDLLLREADASGPTLVGAAVGAG